MNRLFCLLSLVLLSAPDRALAQVGTEKIAVSDLRNIRQIGSVTISPDGRSLAYAVRSIVADPDGDLTYRSQIWTLNTDGTDVPRQLTFDDTGASQPTWHPDSDRITFVRQVSGTSQIFEISVFGGEARQLIDAEHGASAPQWSPNGKLLLFSTTLTQSELADALNELPPWSDERPGRFRHDRPTAEADPGGSLDAIRAWLNANAEEDNPRVFTRLNLQGERDLAPEVEFRHYFMYDAEKRESRMVTRGFYSFSDAVWLPDSRQLVASGFPMDAGHPDRERDRDLFLVDVQNGRAIKLLDIEGLALSAPQVSADATHISFIARDLDDPGYAQSEIGIFALDGRKPPEILTWAFDRSPRGAVWSSDDWFLYFTAASDGGFPLFRLAVNEGKLALPTLKEDEAARTDSTAPDSLGTLARDTFAAVDIARRDPVVERLSSLEHGIRNFDIATGTVYYVLTEARNPYELYSSTLDFSAPRRISDHNTSWLRSKQISVPEAYVLRRDSLDIPYWVMRPTGQEPGRTYPLLVEIHGGPSAMWGPGEATMWHEFQYMAAQGYGIVFGNPRGSGGYGYAFRSGNYKDWGHGPAGDVLAFASEAVRRHRWINQNRQVVTGGSYAGYLTAWIVTQDHRFKAAVAQRGVYDLATFFGEGNAWRLVPSHFGGHPWEVHDLLRANSPQTFVKDIRTPLLIIHADNDLRTGVIQSEVLYKSLKVLGHDVEYVRYPNAGHDLSRSGHPKQRMDRLLRIYEFMERYVGH